MNTNAEKIIHSFLHDLANSAKQHAFNKHMDLISKNVEVYGVPGHELIGYQDWFNQCQSEFADGIIENIWYEGLKVTSSSKTHIMFKTIEHIKTNNSISSATGIEIIISKEDDNTWRITQERILSNDELIHDKNHGLN